MTLPQLRKLSEEEEISFFNTEKNVSSNLDAEDLEECTRLLRFNSTFQHSSPIHLNALCRKSEMIKYKKGEDLIQQAEPQKHMFLLSSGEVTRIRKSDGNLHHMMIPSRKTLFGSLHVLREDPAYSTCRCSSDECEVYRFSSDDYKNELKSSPEMAEQIIRGLSLEIRSYYKSERTPLFEQHATKIPILATSIAAATESYYRSAMNALLNTKLTGARASLFPNMHVQMPSRVMYINGFKGIRYWLDQQYKPQSSSRPGWMGLGLACVPGVVMTPISSILEASNAGHMNKEALWRRWTRGLIPRCGREVVFGIGLNQLSDFVTERTSSTLNPTLRTALGSMGAGVISAYLSHIPHNLSTLKLLQPELSYARHFSNLAEKSVELLPKAVPTPLRFPAALLLSVLAPRGILIRTTQVVGSFILLNGTIHFLQDVN